MVSPNRKCFIAFAIAVALVLFSAGAGTAVAADTQTAAAAQASVGENSGTLEEVIVTARRRSEDLQQVPISIATLSAVIVRSIVCGIT